MNTKVIYIHPDNEDGSAFVSSLSPKEKLHYAKNNNAATVYDNLKSFEEAFNNGDISDEGFIFYVQQ